MNKDEILKELSLKVSTGEISHDEIAAHYSLPPTTQSAVVTKDLKVHTPFSVTKVLYVLGAAIVLVGVAVFVSQIWDDLSSFGRIAVTLGIGFLATASGSMLLKIRPEQSIGIVFQFIGGILISGGSVVTLSELNVDLNSLLPVAVTFGGICAFYLLLNSVHKNAILTLFAIANGTAFVCLTIETVIDGRFSNKEDLYPYIVMVIGVSYLLLAHSFRNGWNRALSGFLYLFGITGFLGAAFSLVFDSTSWQVFYFAIVTSSLYIAVFEKSRSILVMSTLFLIAHVCFITSEHFSDSLGWPVSLVILGFVFIGLGFVSININKRYLAN